MSRRARQARTTSSPDAMSCSTSAFTCVEVGQIDLDRATGREEQERDPHHRLAGGPSDRDRVRPRPGGDSPRPARRAAPGRSCPPSCSRRRPARRGCGRAGRCSPRAVARRPTACRRRPPASAGEAAAACTIDEPSAKPTSFVTSPTRSGIASAWHCAATASARPSPDARSMVCSTPCTARPTADPYRPFSHGGWSMSRGRFSRPSFSSSSASSPPSSVSAVAAMVDGRDAVRERGSPLGLPLRERRRRGGRLRPRDRRRR